MFFACSKDEDINSGSTASTVVRFPEFKLNTPFQEKVLDTEGNLYAFVELAGSHSVGESSFKTNRNNTLVKLDPAGNFITEYPGVRPMLFNKISLGDNDIIYMNSASTNSTNIVKMSTDGDFISSNRIISSSLDVEANANGDYFLIEPDDMLNLDLKKLSSENQLIWSAATGLNRIEFRRMMFSDVDNSLLVLSAAKLSKYSSESGELLWEYQIDEMICSQVFSSPLCVSGFIDTDDQGNAYLAYVKRGLKDTELIEYVEMVKLDNSGNPLFTKVIRSEERLREDIFVTGMSVFEGHFYMAINSTFGNIRSFNSEKAFIAKYDARTGDEVWRQSPSWQFISLDDYSPSKFDFSLFPVFIKDMIQSKVDGRLWCSIAIDIPTVIRDPEDISQHISRVDVKIKMGSAEITQTLVPNHIIYRNITVLDK